MGQDLEQDLEADGEAGALRIARRVATDRMISTVDPDARHGHKSSACGFDGYEGTWRSTQSEIVTATTVTAGNAGDAEPARYLLADDPPTATATGDSAGPAVRCRRGR